MKNTVWFESCLKEKLNSYMELRESQGHKTSKIRLFFISLDQYLQKAGLSSQSLPPAVIDGWIASLPKKLNVNTVNIYISTYYTVCKISAVTWIRCFYTGESNRQQELFSVYIP